MYLQLRPILETAVGAFAGTAGGAILVYSFQRRNETNDRRHEQFVGGMNAEFSTRVYVSVLKGVKTELLDPLERDPERHLKLLPSLVPSVEPPLQLGALGFAVENRNADLAKRMSQLVERFSNIRDIITRRNESHQRLQRFRAQWQASIDNGYPAVPTGVDQVEKPALLALTDMLYAAVPATIAHAEKLRADLRGFLMQEFPKEQLPRDEKESPKENDTKPE